MDEGSENRYRADRGAGGHAIGKLGDVWWSLTLRGLLAGLLGLCALFWPSVSLSLLVVFVGIFLLVDGLTGLLGAMRAAAGGAEWAQPLLGLVLGALLLFWPGASLRLLLAVFGVWAVLFGVSQVMTARRLPQGSGERGFMTRIGTLAAVIGLILAIWPGSGVVAISWVIAGALFLLSAILLFLALRMKRLRDRLREARPRRVSAP